MFDADRPIQKSSQDRLNRSTFSKYLARCMLDHANPQSLVIGLHGGWGVGKTSIINMAIEELHFAASNLEDQQKPIILNFSPWSYSGQNQLIYSFFRRLSSTLRNVDYLENKERIIHLLELYVSFFTHQPIPKPLRTKRSWWHTLTGQHREEIYAWESGRDLTLVKSELNELLEKQQHKIIIIIDNISRIQPEEIKQMFQIVKSMGDYANTVFLLSYDKEQVVSAINKIDGSGALDLIEKVVQLPFAVPPILQQDIENIFADHLNAMLAQVQEESWNTEYWADIYYSSLKYFFDHCRDITRYINTLNFGYSRLKDIVNPVDFFALTAIEVFEPDVYAGIRDNKDLFTDLLDNVYAMDKDHIAKDKLRCDEILARTQHVPHEAMLELLIKLFPRLRSIYQADLVFYHSESIARKLHRICSPDLFDAYFRLSIQSGQIPASEFETILGLASDTTAFDQALTRLNQDDRITKFLDQLDTKVLNKVPIKNIPSIVSALLDDGDLFPPGNTGPLSLDTPMREHRIIHRLLRRLASTQERFTVLQNAITNANKSIHIIVHELREQAREHLESEDTFLPLEYRDITPEQLASLQKLTVNRIEYWAQTGRLAEHPRLMPLLFAWRDWGHMDDCKRFVEQMTNTDKGLVAFLTCALEKAISQAMTEYEVKPAWTIYLNDIEAFISPSRLVDHAKTLFEDGYFEKLREREQLALLIFLDLTKAHTSKHIPKTTL